MKEKIQSMRSSYSSQSPSSSSGGPTDEIDDLHSEEEMIGHHTYNPASDRSLPYVPGGAELIMETLGDDVPSCRESDTENIDTQQVEEII